MHVSPFETQNVSTLAQSHFRMHPSLPLPTSKSVTGVTPHRQTYPTTPENYGFPKTDALVTSVTIPFRSLLPSRGKRGCRTPLRGSGAHGFSINYAIPFLLFLHPLLLGPASHSPALGPSAPRHSPRGCRTTDPPLAKPLDAPPSPVIIARPHTHARAQ